MTASRSRSAHTLSSAGIESAIVYSSVRTPLAERTSRMRRATRKMRSMRSIIGSIGSAEPHLPMIDTTTRKKSKQFHPCEK
eukprot:6689961-Prymnesium_polylepis.2